MPVYCTVVEGISNHRKKRAAIADQLGNLSVSGELQERPECGNDITSAQQRFRRVQAAHGLAEASVGPVSGSLSAPPSAANLEDSRYLHAAS